MARRRKNGRPKREPEKWYSSALDKCRRQLLAINKEVYGWSYYRIGLNAGVSSTTVMKTLEGHSVFIELRTLQAIARAMHCQIVMPHDGPPQVAVVEN
jgi:hypothetical protein